MHPQIIEVPIVDRNNYYLGKSIADLSPLQSDLGIYLYPEAALKGVDVPDIETGEHECLRWSGSAWELCPDYSGQTLYCTKDASLVKAERGQSLEELDATLLEPLPEQTWDKKKQCWTYSLTQLKVFKLAELAQLRWEMQSAGVRVANIDEAIFASSPEDLSRLKSVLEDTELMAEMAGADLITYQVTFKVRNGFYDLTVAQLKLARVAIVKHTQDCFNAERAHSEQINAYGTPNDLEKHILLEGWPV